MARTFLVLALFLCTACSGAEELESTPAKPIFSRAQIETDLRRTLEVPTVNPATGFTSLVTYAEAQMRAAWLHPAYAPRFVLRFSSERDTLPPVGVLGYVPGKHPERMTGLVLVLSRLDGLAGLGAAPQVPGLGAATVLEGARQFSTFSRRFQVPEHTILFALFSESESDVESLRAYLSRPAWPLEETRAVIYVGIEDTSRVADGLRTLLRPHDVPLYTVPPPRRPTLPDGQRVLSPLRRAIQDVLYMAERLNLLLLREAVTPAPFAPVSPDTLRIPTG